MTIDILPDVALLEIFHFYVGGERINYVDEKHIEAWHTLAHVCRHWRMVLFGSPRRLGLRLCCTPKTPVRETLDVWPLLPIAIRVYAVKNCVMDNIIAAVQHNDRICELELLSVSSSQMEYVLAAMQQPFPVLARMWLQPKLGETMPVIPASFLGGSAPRLHALWLDYISFPGLPKLLLSATHLVDLDFRRIPHSGYISPEAIVTCLSALTRLESLVLGFESPRSRPDSRRPPPLSRTFLPVLRRLAFKGVGKYLENLVALIDAPLLDYLFITFFHQLIFETPQLAQFISRTPKFKTHDEARVVFSDGHVRVTLPQTFNGNLRLGISCRQLDWQLSSLAQVCGLSFPQALIPTVEDLYIQIGFPRRVLQDDIENSQWFELFHPFAAVKHLYLSQVFVPLIAAPALQELVQERVTEVLPALEILFLEKSPLSRPDLEAIGLFVAARRRASNPITVSLWEKGEKDKFYEHEY